MSGGRLSGLVGRKLAALSAYLDELATTIPDSEAAYRADQMARRAVERVIQIVVECATDAADLLLALEGTSVGETAREVFTALRSEGIVEAALAERFIREYGGLRNWIVHDYDVLDDHVVWQKAMELVHDGRALLAALTQRVGAGQSPSGGSTAT